MVQHQDPLVYNKFTGQWQNASTAGPSGSPIGITIGSILQGGSNASMLPSVGQSISVDGTATATIESAFQAATGAASEQTPGYIASVVYNTGLASEQLGTIHVGSLGASTGQAILTTGESADGTIHGSVKIGTLAPGTGGATWNFTTMHAWWPHSNISQMATGWGLYATSQQSGGGANAESWTKIQTTPGFQNSFSDGGSSTEYSAQYHFAALGNGVVFFRGLVQTPSSGSVNGVTFCDLPAGYRPINSVRWPVVSKTAGTATGFITLFTGGSMQFTGIPATNGALIDISGKAHIGSVP